jgi:hypothetical protein
MPGMPKMEEARVRRKKKIVPLHYSIVPVLHHSSIP